MATSILACFARQFFSATDGDPVPSDEPPQDPHSSSSPAAVASLYTTCSLWSSGEVFIFNNEG